MKHYYLVSPYQPQPPPAPFDWKRYNELEAERKHIIQTALARHFRETQAAMIKELITTKVCPKCRGRLLPSEDGLKCFSCGMIVYQEIFRPYEH